MTLATVDQDGQPDARIVLLRGVDERGFVWFTNRNSREGPPARRATRSAALVFVWLPLHRQVRVTGTVTQIDDSESDAYFATRPRESQIGAWASVQSEVLVDRCARRRGRRHRGALSRRRGAASPALGRISPRARDARGVAGPRQPAARPLPLQPWDLALAIERLWP